jgi:uncharacterized coiled-coil protein SlyX
MKDKRVLQEKYLAQLALWRADLDRLKAQAKIAGADVKLTLNERITHLENRVEEARKRFNELTESSDEAWDALEQGVATAWQDLTEAFEDAASKFKK